MQWPFGSLHPGRYGLILVDPPWAMKTWGESDSEKMASAKYAVMSRDDIMALPVGKLASRDCVLVMWCVQAMMPEGYETVRAWGFEPKTLGTWAKQSRTGAKWHMGTGYVLRSAAEFYIFATRGSPKSAVKNVRNLIVAPVREHSRKPDKMHIDLERMYPNVPKVELFARQRRPGWDCWGNQVDKFPQTPSHQSAQDEGDSGARPGQGPGEVLRRLRAAHRAANLGHSSRGRWQRNLPSARTEEEA